MKRLNIYELHSEINKKKEHRTKSLDHVLERCHTKIRNASKKELHRTWFEVPEFIIGLPVYNLNDCIIHLMTSLNQNGFVVKYFFPKVLYISWDFDEINQCQNIALAKDLISHSGKNPQLEQLRSVDAMLLTSKAHKVIDTSASSSTPPRSKCSSQQLTIPPIKRGVVNDLDTTIQNRPNMRNLPNGKFVLNLE